MLALKFIIGLALLPVCWVSLETFLLLFKKEALSGAFYKVPEFFFFAAGAVLCLLGFRRLRTNRAVMWFYVAGHELTHAIFAMLFRGTVKDIRITATRGGYIETNRNNFLISLSPYFFPFFTILAVLIWSCMEWLFAGLFDTGARFWLYGLIGLTWMFHISYSIWMLSRGQSDVKYNGKLFSYTVIFLINILLISLLLVIASPEATFRGFAGAWLTNLETLGDRLRQSLEEIFGT